jgi:choline dehydrogenase-like flavoprotein
VVCGSGNAVGLLVRSGRRVVATRNDPPRIQPAHLKHPDDLARIVEGARHARRVLRAEPLAGHVIGPELPPWRELDDEDQAALECVVRAGVGTYHPVGTCRMGAVPETGAESRPPLLGQPGTSFVIKSAAGVDAEALGPR